MISLFFKSADRNSNKMNDGQKTAEYVKELATCVYNKIKKREITCGLFDIINEGNGKHVQNENDYLEDDHTIEEIEKYLEDNFDYCTGYEYWFNFDEEETKDVFDGQIEIRYKENEREEFVPVVYLGIQPLYVD